MPRLSKITTRTGDTGLTGLADGVRLPKHALIIQAIGDVDELNAQLGVLFEHIEEKEIKTHLDQVQQALFHLGAELCYPNRPYEYLHEAHLKALETAIEAINTQLTPLKEFILPRGKNGAAEAHVCRTLCRRAERTLSHYIDAHPEDEPRLRWLQYLNRLSDWLFVVARQRNETTIFWEKNK